MTPDYAYSIPGFVYIIVDLKYELPFYSVTMFRQMSCVSLCKILLLVYVKYCYLMGRIRTVIKLFFSTIPLSQFWFITA